MNEVDSRTPGGRTDVFSQLYDCLNNLNGDFEKNGFAADLANWQAKVEIPSMTTIPQLLRYGSLQLIDAPGFPAFPLLLPTNVNAVLLNIGDSENLVPNLFQNIICRLLLTMRMDLVKVSVIDKDYGRSFPFVPEIKNLMFEKRIIHLTGDIKKLIEDLERTVEVVNSKLSIHYNDIGAYNEDVKQMAMPYHFVFIDDFPKGFDSDCINRLLGLIENGNASKAGIKIFINYSKNNEVPREFDFQRFMEVCSSIVKTSSQNKEDLKATIRAIVPTPEIGQVYHGMIVSIMAFGAFVEIAPNKLGLLHISEIDWKRFENMKETGLKVGDKIDVKLIEIDEKTSELRLSRRALLPKPDGYRGEIRGKGNPCDRTNEDDPLVFYNWSSCAFPSNVRTSLETGLTKSAMDIASFLNTIPMRGENYSLEWWIEELKTENKVWSGSTMEGIKVPVGIMSNGNLFEFNIGTDLERFTRDYFGLIVGRSGSGKTTLLRNIIINTALKYSPDELCMYLVDFAGGTGFNVFKELPHVDSIMVAKDKVFALSILQDLEKELSAREELYNEGSNHTGKIISDLPSYRKITGEILPRILVIIDEAHNLFAKDTNDAVANEARRILAKGVREWRKFGISIILCTQSVNEAGFGDADNKITYRFSFNLTPEESRMAIRNTGAAQLPPSSRAIMNNSLNGDEKANVEFLSAFFGPDSQIYSDNTKYLATLYEQKYGKRKIAKVRGYGKDVDFANNKEVAKYFNVIGRPQPNYQSCNIYVGKPNLPRDSHTRIRYCRQPNSNTLIIGEDLKTLVLDVAVQLLQLYWQSYTGSKFFVVDCSMHEGYKGAFDRFNSLDAFKVCDSIGFSACLDEITEELEKRKLEKKEGKMSNTRIVLTILNAQNSDDLLPIPNIYNRMDPSETNNRLKTLMMEGAPLGIHCIIHGLSYGVMFENPRSVFQSSLITCFTSFICLNCSRGDGIHNFMSKLDIPNPDKGWMMVDNANLDGYQYEQCNPYTLCSLDTTDPALKLVMDLFKKYQ